MCAAPATAPLGGDPSAARVTVGVDLVAVARVARLVREQPAIVDRLFTTGEQAAGRGRRHGMQRLAARFAAKEAVLKALGTGLSAGMAWTDIEIVNERRGRPRVRLSGEVAAAAGRGGLTAIDVSLSHTADLAIAQVIATFVTRAAQGAPCPGR